MFCAGCVVYNYAVSGTCSPKEGTRRYEPKLGTSGLIRHKEAHETTREQDVFTPVTISMPQKRMITDGAVFAVVNGTLPFDFCYRKGGMLKVCQSLLEVGQGIPATRTNDVPKALPSSNTVHAGISRLSKRMREDFMKGVSTVLEIGGGITCDGLKNELTGAKYCDFVLHYIQAASNVSFQVDISHSVQSSIHRREWGT